MNEIRAHSTIYPPRNRLPHISSLPGTIPTAPSLWKDSGGISGLLGSDFNEGNLNEL